MKNKISDNDVLELLTTLKNSENNYPQDLIAARRDTFAKQAAATIVLMKAGANGANAAGASTTASTTTSAASATTTSVGGSLGGILETVLTIAIVAELGVAAYLYRDKIADFISSTFGSKVEQVSTPTDNSAAGLISPGNGNPTVTPFPTETPTVTVTETPTLTETITITPATENYNGITGSGNPQSNSTPTPNVDNGNHYGNTPKPERTKDVNGYSLEQNNGIPITKDKIKNK